MLCRMVAMTALHSAGIARNVPLVQLRQQRLEIGACPTSRFPDGRRTTAARVDAVPVEHGQRMRKPAYRLVHREFHPPHA
jgi:hypothetical protein